MKYVGYDYAGDMERMHDNPKVREWWAMTDGFQEVSKSMPHISSIPIRLTCSPQSLVPGATSSEAGEPWWQELEEVFYTS